MSRYDKTCPECGKKFRTKNLEQRTCSTPCARKRKYVFEIRSCGQCGSTFPPASSVQRWCKVCAPTRLARLRISEYGLDQTQFDAMYFEQDGSCAVCLDKEAAYVDHDHSTGAVRALLCMQCNAGLGNFYDDSTRLGRAIEYLKEYQYGY